MYIFGGLYFEIFLFLNAIKFDNISVKIQEIYNRLESTPHEIEDCKV